MIFILQHFFYHGTMAFRLECAPTRNSIIGPFFQRAFFVDNVLDNYLYPAIDKLTTLLCVPRRVIKQNISYGCHAADRLWRLSGNIVPKAHFA